MKGTKEKEEREEEEEEEDRSSNSYFHGNRRRKAGQSGYFQPSHPELQQHQRSGAVFKGQLSESLQPIQFRKQQQQSRRRKTLSSNEEEEEGDKDSSDHGELSRILQGFLDEEASGRSQHSNLGHSSYHDSSKVNSSPNSRRRRRRRRSLEEEEEDFGREDGKVGACQNIDQLSASQTSPSSSPPLQSSSHNNNNSNNNNNNNNMQSLIPSSAAEPSSSLNPFNESTSSSYQQFGPGTTADHQINYADSLAMLTSPHSIDSGYGDPGSVGSAYPAQDSPWGPYQNSHPVFQSAVEPAAQSQFNKLHSTDDFSEVLGDGGDGSGGQEERLVNLQTHDQEGINQILDDVLNSINSDALLMSTDQIELATLCDQPDLQQQQQQHIHLAHQQVGGKEQHQQQAGPER